VFPHVDAHQRHHSRVHVRNLVLLCSGLNANPVLRFVIHDPAPAGALHCGRSLLKALLEVLPRAPSADDLFVEQVLGVGSVRVGDGAERFPEELVVEVATAIKLHRLRDLNMNLHVVVLEGLVRLRDQRVQVVHVSAVVLAVVVFHCLAGDDWLERAHVVGQVLRA